MRRPSGPVLPALLFAIVTRLGLFFAVWLTGRVLPKLALYPAQLPDQFLPDHPALDGWARWDTAHYVALARFGYSTANPSDAHGLAFLPHSAVREELHAQRLVSAPPAHAPARGQRAGGPRAPAGPPPPPMPAEGPRMCPADVRICPDGSAVSRNGANDCAFDPCPAGSP